MDWFCTKCHRVISTKELKCCGMCVEFDPIKHSIFLIPGSNAWVSVWEGWKNNPLFKKISEQCIEDGCYSSAIIFNIFIDELIRKMEEIIE